MTSKTKRAVSQKTRFEVFKRDRFTCQYCGAHPPGVLLHVDHIVALAAGGSNAIGNLVTACEPCNLGKGARDLKVAPMSLAKQAKEIAEREAQLAGYGAAHQQRQLRINGEAWDALERLLGDGVKVSVDMLLGTKRFVERLGLPAVMEAVEISLASNVPYGRLFRYFCGVCWNRVRQINQEA